MRRNASDLATPCDARQASHNVGRGAGDLLRLAKHHAYIRLGAAVHTNPSPPFSILRLNGIATSKHADTPLAAVGACETRTDASAGRGDTDG